MRSSLPQLFEKLPKVAIKEVTLLKIRKPNDQVNLRAKSCCENQQGLLEKRGIPHTLCDVL